MISEILMNFSFLSGCYALMIVITQDTMGDFKFSAAYGTLLFVEALGVVIGPPIAGWLKDRLGNYSSTLFVSGSLLIVSGQFYFRKALIYLIFSLFTLVFTVCQTTASTRESSLQISYSTADSFFCINSINK